MPQHVCPAGRFVPTVVGKIASQRVGHTGWGRAKVGISSLCSLCASWGMLRGRCGWLGTVWGRWGWHSGGWHLGWLGRALDTWLCYFISNPLLLLPLRVRWRSEELWWLSLRWFWRTFWGWLCNMMLPWISIWLLVVFCSCWKW